MNDANNSPKSQNELIIEKFLNNLKKHPEFDDVTLTKLKELASSGNLTKHTLVEKAIKAQAGKEK